MHQEGADHQWWDFICSLPVSGDDHLKRAANPGTEALSQGLGDSFCTEHYTTQLAISLLQFYALIARENPGANDTTGSQSAQKPTSASRSDRFLLLSLLVTERHLPCPETLKMRSSSAKKQLH